MKKNIRILLTVVLALVMAFSFTACDTQNGCEKGNHTWDAGVVTKPATCTDKGEKTFTCTVEGCGATKVEEIAIDATAHKLGDVVVATAPTCSATGNVAYTECELCHKTFNEAGTQEISIEVAIDGTAHVWGKWTAVEGQTKHTRVCTLNSEHVETADCDLADTYAFNGTQHWNVCATCGNTSAPADHAYTAGKCVCGAVHTDNFTTTTLGACIETAPTSGNSASKYFAIGVITEIDDAYVSNYNNISVVISDGTGELLLYRLSGGSDLVVGDVIVVYGFLTSYNGEAQFAQGCIYVEKNGEVLKDGDTAYSQDQLIVDDCVVPAIAKEGFTLTDTVTWSIKEGSVDGITLTGNVVDVVRSTEKDVVFTLVATRGTATAEYTVTVPQLTNSETEIVDADSLGISIPYADGAKGIWAWDQLYKGSQNGHAVIQMNYKNNKYSSFWNTEAFANPITAVVINWNSATNVSNTISVEFSTTADFAEDTVEKITGITKETSSITVPAGEWKYIRITNEVKYAVYLDSVHITTSGPCDHPATYVSHVDAKNATCTEDGCKEHYLCAVCKNTFADEACTTPVTDVVIPASHTLSDVSATAANCTTDGVVAHKHCSVCEKNFDADGTELATVVAPATGHSTATYTHEGCQAGYHKQVCTNANCPTTFDEVACTLVYDKNESQHWQVCSVCGYQTAKVAHEHPDNANCVCGKPFDCDHDGAKDYVIDDNGHHTICAICKDVATATETVAHNVVYTQVEGTTTHTGACVCGHKVAAADCAGDWTKTADNHSKTCATCAGTIVAETAHTKVWSYENDSHSFKCSDCEYVSEATEHDYTDSVCVCGRYETVHAGTEADPYSVADALKVIDILGEKVYSQKVYVTGVVSAMDKAKVNSSNAEFILKDSTTDATLTAYKIYFTDTIKAINVNDTVVINGFLVLYDYGKDEVCGQKIDNVWNNATFTSHTLGTSTISVGDTGESVVTLDATSGVNGTTFTFSVVVNADNILDAVKVNDVAVTAGEDGKYTGTIAGNTVVTVATHGKDEKPATEVKYTMSEYTAGTQYAQNEVHVLDPFVTVTTTKCHFTSELRIYSNNTNDGYAIISSTAVITKIVINAGNKEDTLNVYGSTDGTTWTLIQGVTVEEKYKDYTIEIADSTYTYIKLDVAGTQQVRVKYFTLTTIPCSHETDDAHHVVGVASTCTT